MVKNEKAKSVSIFSLEYWKIATSELNNLKVICIMSLMVALNVVISTFFIPVSENLRIYFTFIPTSIAGIIGGPVFALIYGFLTDIVGCIVHPPAMFFPGYMLSTMLGALIYSLFFYNKKITVFKIFLCKLSVNVFINIGLNSLWSAILFNKGFYYFVVKSIVKNLALLPIEVIILAGLLRLIVPVLRKMGIVRKSTVALM